MATVLCFLVIPNASIAEDHWAFRPVVSPDVPGARQSPGNEIDAFIFDRLDREGIAPSPEADRVTLISRLTLDLIGLRPTPAEVDAFVNDDCPAAYERLVDRLLASPHYGERWASPWLDLCHYADSDGYLTDQLRPVAWRYREWLVNALNANLPFDRFTIEQLAGDLLPGASAEQKIATGFLRQTLSHREGGADLEEFRVKQILDRTAMMGATWLGLTVGCAQCHDHKYDPLSQREFYGLYAFFDNADEVNIDVPLPHERDAWLNSRPEYERRRRELVSPLEKDLTSLQQRWEQKLLHAAAHPGEDHVWDRQWELLGLVWGGHLGEGQLEGTEIVKRPWSERSVRQKDDLLDYFLGSGAVIAPERFAELKLAEFRNQLLALKKEFPQATRAAIMQAALTPRQTHLFERGDFRYPSEPVEPATPDWLPPVSAVLKPAVSGSAGPGVVTPVEAVPPRLALARWLVAPENPLTARVTVNRFWQELFGRGLVFTAGDFGIRGARPSHPELLERLAARFVQSGWDVKSMLRLMVTSATYRQMSTPRPELESRDPENVFLSRQSSLRLPAETVRDLGLQASGLLSRKLGGPSVHPPQPERVTMEAFGSNDWKVSEGEDRYRRGVYTTILRTSPFAQSVTFDAPNPNDVCTRRFRSNTPLQALTLLNDPVFFEMAESLAARVLREQPGSVQDRLDAAVRLCLARRPTPPETERLRQYLDSQLAAFGRDPPRAKAVLRHATDAIDLVEAAAWTELCSVLLNVHEFITRD